MYSNIFIFFHNKSFLNCQQFFLFHLVLFNDPLNFFLLFYLLMAKLLYSQLVVQQNCLHQRFLWRKYLEPACRSWSKRDLWIMSHVDTLLASSTEGIFYGICFWQCQVLGSHLNSIPLSSYSGLGNSASQQIKTPPGHFWKWLDRPSLDWNLLFLVTRGWLAA